MKTPGYILADESAVMYLADWEKLYRRFAGVDSPELFRRRHRSPFGPEECRHWYNVLAYDWIFWRLNSACLHVNAGTRAGRVVWWLFRVLNRFVWIAEPWTLRRHYRKQNR
jgi:hypothetical protein